MHIRTNPWIILTFCPFKINSAGNSPFSGMVRIARIPSVAGPWGPIFAKGEALKLLDLPMRHAAPGCAGFAHTIPIPWPKALEKETERKLQRTAGREVLKAVQAEGSCLWMI
jgi:hypothetical protein